MVRRLAVVALLLLGVASAHAGSVDVLDAEDGFRGARFGTPIESFQDLELISSRGAGGTRLYVRASEELRLGGAVLDGVTYGFYQGDLYFVALFTSGARNADAALAQLERVYGPGRKLDGATREYVWKGKRVSLYFREDAVTSMGMVGITSLSIDRRVKTDRISVPANAAD